MTMATFSDRIKNLMDENNLNYVQMGEKTGMSKSVIRDWVMQGHYPNAFNLMIVAQTFDVSCDWLLGMSNHRKVKR